MPTWKGIVGRGFRSQEFKEYVGTLSFSGWRPQFVVLHNTSAPKLSQWHSTPGVQRMRNLEDYYKNRQHWSSGPHLFIADDLIWVFTPLTTSGTHSPSWNRSSWGIEMVGEYNQEPFNAGVRENTVDALAILHTWRGLNPETLRFHKEDPATSHTGCPGSNVNKQDMIRRIKERMAAGKSGEHVPEDNYIEIGAGVGTPLLEVAPGAISDAAPGVAGEQLTGPAASRTKDGAGRSRTSGLVGSADGDSMEAAETLEAMRDGKSLGPARTVKQVRVASSDKIRVHQAGYCWGNRTLPDATLFVNHAGFAKAQADYSGEASYFGKHDPEDEGTGSPGLGIVHTNSSVFGVALPKGALIKANLAEAAGRSIRLKPAALNAMVEVYYPAKKRMVRVPLVDVGPRETTGRPVDLTVAAAAFLLEEDEEKAKGYKMKNLQVELRIT